MNMPATAAGGRNYAHSAAHGLQGLGRGLSVCPAERRLNHFTILRSVEVISESLAEVAHVERVKF